jgi:small subunit ribosomal protein S14
MAKKSSLARYTRPKNSRFVEYTRCERCGRPHAVYLKIQALPYLPTRVSL